MKRLILIAALCLAPTLAFAQAPPTVRLCNGTQPNCPLVSNSNPLPTSATATVTGFAPGGTYATLTATASSADAALPAGAVVTAWNTGTTSVSCVIGVGAQTATASKNIIPSGGSWFAFTVGSNTHLACINQAGDGASNVVVLSGGSGLPTGSGGGGGGSSSTITNWGSGSNTLGAMANYGTSPGAVLVPGVNASITNTPTVTANLGTLGGAATAANQATEISSLATIATNTGAAIPSQAVTVPIGGVTNDPCQYAAKTNLPISFQTTSITQQIALSGSTKIYVCSLSLIASAATVFSITGGTGTNCGTPAALIGTTSATHGLSLVANGGLTLGNGGGTVAVTGAGSELCLVQSGAGDLVGNLTYVQQ